VLLRAARHPANPNGIGVPQIGILSTGAFHVQSSCGRIPIRPNDEPGGHVVTDDERRTAFVDLELAAVWQGRERGWSPTTRSTSG
jgi:hypothetical protein